MKRKFLRFLFTFLLILSFATNSYAAHVGGGKIVDGSTSGAYCEITTYSDPPVASSGDNISCIWTMLTGNTIYKYAQVGWIKRTGYSDRRYFFEYSNTSTDWSRITSTTGPATNSKHTYMIGFGSGNDVYGKVDGAQIGMQVLDWRLVTTASYFGERNGTPLSSGTYFPGTQANHERIDVPQYRLNGAWTPITSMSEWQQDTNAGLDTTYFNSGNNYRFDIWDKRR